MRCCEEHRAVGLQTLGVSEAVVAEREISPSEVEELGEKLDRFGETLSAKDRTVLLGLFGVAGTTLRRSLQGLGDATGMSEEPERQAAEPRRVVHVAPSVLEIPPLSEGFKEAFTPGTAGRFAFGETQVEDSIGVTVGAICVSVTWSKDVELLHKRESPEAGDVDILE
jgi:hypothetical protein